tara:strand:+ start:1485 stop:1664 length:180 start_codon:yes stop_codon:yes gene_type:complete
MQVGDLVKVETKHEGKVLGIITEQHFSPLGREWYVKRLDSQRYTLAQSCDIEVVSSASR